MRLATTLVGPADAEDLVSETVQRVVLSVSIGEIREPAGYLVRSLVNAAAAGGRASQRRSRREQHVARRERVEPFDLSDVVDVLRAVGILSAAAGDRVPRLLGGPQHPASRPMA